MSIDVDPGMLKGKLAALAPSFEIMAEITGKVSTATMMGLHATHYVRQGLAMDEVNTAVRELMLGWDKYGWPSPELVAARAFDVRRRAIYGDSEGGNRWAAQNRIEADAAAQRWEHRVDVANDWRERNPGRFRLDVMPVVEQDYQDRLRRVARMRESRKYRESFKEAAVIGRCLCLDGVDYRAAQRQQAIDIERAARAMMLSDESLPD